MVWLPSHSTLARHPKLKRAARLAGVSEPAMIGHLHLLWWWALELAPDGDLSAFDREDVADAAGWDGDPDALVEALIECGPGKSSGFIEPNMTLHDWDEYGGRYGKRVEAAKKAARIRWDKRDNEAQNANALPEQEQAQGNGNTEERRGEEKREEKKKRKTSMVEDWQPDQANLTRLKERYPKLDVNVEVQKFRDHWLSKGETRADWNAGLRTWFSNAETYRQRHDGERMGGWR
jgi:hypothetical protein